ncbi:MAG: efflux RND transporter permease subunit [Treponema sp.]|jgi:multidrug efflux pump subunit AcrB|nr:efflux RND transporter permease subunit [Treponema sp.]
MKGIITLCVRRPVTVIMAMAALVTAALFSLSALSLERLPELSEPKLTVETVYTGMAADDMRSLVTIPVEDALSPVKGLERIRSVSRDGRSIISLDFRWRTDPAAAAALVREAIDAVYPGLPEGVLKPVVTAGDYGDDPHAIIAVRSIQGDGSFARRLAEYELRARLRKIDGVGSIVLAGGEIPEGRLRLDVQKLAALGISPPDFAGILSGETADIPAGNAREGDMELVVVSSGRPGTVEELSELIIPAGGGAAALKLGDTGDLNIEAGRRNSVFIFEGREAVALEIFRRPGADPLRLSRDIRKTLKETAPLFSRDAEIIMVRDSAPSLIRGIIGLLISAGLGAAAVIAVLFLFIRRLRYSLLAALSIPLSTAAGICVLAITEKSLNSMSLGGLALGIGLVSDTGVIVLDLLHRAFGADAEKPPPEKIGEKAASIAGSSAASTLTTAVVFVPVIFLPGPLGSLFGDTAVALVVSISAGWLYAQFCLPSLYRMFFTADRCGFGALCVIEKKYRHLLAPPLRRPFRIFALAALASIAGGLFLLLRPAVFISPDEAEEVRVSVVFPPGTLPENIGAGGAAISRTVSELPAVKTVYGRAGAEEEDIGRRADTDYLKEELVIYCVLNRGSKPEKALAEITETVNELKNQEDGLLDTAISAYLPRDRTETYLGLSSARTFAVTGKDREEAAERAAAVARRLGEYTGSGGASIALRPRGRRPELRLYPNREAAAYLGVSSMDIAESLYTLSEGVVTSRLEIEGRPLDVRVSGRALSEFSGGSGPEALLENIPLTTSQGKIVFLGSLGRIERREAEAALARLDRSDVIYLDLPPSKDRKIAGAVKEMSAGFSWFDRASESVFSRYRNSLLLNICLVLILLYITMGAQFESFLLPLIFMLTIPFSLAGSGPALLLFDAALDSGAALGLTALFGLVVNNGLILFEISDEKIRSGCSPAAAVYRGASRRLRPVLITAATTVFALLPVALNPLGNAQKSMAAAMLGGLAASTLLSLFALPPVLIRFFRWRGKR